MHYQVNKNELKMAEALRALAHPVRLRILRLLNGEAGKMTVTDIQKNVGLTQPETSRHLLIMKQHEILTSSKEGIHVFYSVNRENQVADYFANARKFENK